MSDKVKICMVGATGVGKTSLVARYARSIFSDRYRTTIGVAIETRRANPGRLAGRDSLEKRAEPMTYAMA